MIDDRLTPLEATMPDPGEPHRPQREHFASDADYRKALETTYPPELSLSDQEMRDIEEFLEDHRDR
jgi:hypothetical protein